MRIDEIKKDAQAKSDTNKLLLIEILNQLKQLNKSLGKGSDKNSNYSKKR